MDKHFGFVGLHLSRSQGHVLRRGKRMEELKRGCWRAFSQNAVTTIVDSFVHLCSLVAVGLYFCPDTS